MNTRTFFKLYSLPFLIIVLGVGLYVAVVMLMDKKNLIISKRPQTHTSHIAGVDSQLTSQGVIQVAQSTESSKENSNEGKSDEGKQVEADSLPHKTSPQETQDIVATTPSSVESPSQATSPNPATKQDSNNTQDSGNGIDIAQNTVNIPSTPSNLVDTKPSTAPAVSIQDSKQKYGYAKYRINIRQAPNSESAIISRAAVGEALEILSDGQDGWSKVKSRFGVEGYVASRLLTQNLTSQDGEPYIVVANALNVRSKADSQGAVIGRLSHNMRIYVLETQGEWAKIQLPNKQYGYISLNHISKSVY
nr:SH3 domain-containing protein [uncultured Helicobacter sp.]